MSIRLITQWLLRASLAASAACVFLPCAAGAQTITAGTASGARGTSVWFDVKLNPQGKSIGGTQNEVSFNATNTPVTTCLVDSSYGKDLSYSLLPAGCGTGTCNKVKGLILNTSDTSAMLAPTVLYRCRIDIPSNAAVGTYSLTVQNAAGSDPDGNPKTVTGISGQVNVQ